MVPKHLHHTCAKVYHVEIRVQSVGVSTLITCYLRIKLRVIRCGDRSLHQLTLLKGLDVDQSSPGATGETYSLAEGTPAHMVYWPDQQDDL